MKGKSRLISKLVFRRKVRKSLILRNSSNLPLKQLQISSWVTYENVIYVKEHVFYSYIKPVFVAT